MTQMASNGWLHSCWLSFSQRLWRASSFSLDCKSWKSCRMAFKQWKSCEANDQLTELTHLARRFATKTHLLTTKGRHACTSLRFPRHLPLLQKKKVWRKKESEETKKENNEWVDKTTNGSIQCCLYTIDIRFFNTWKTREDLRNLHGGNVPWWHNWSKSQVSHMSESKGKRGLGAAKSLALPPIAVRLKGKKF